MRDTRSAHRVSWPFLRSITVPVIGACFARICAPSYFLYACSLFIPHRVDTGGPQKNPTFAAGSSVAKLACSSSWILLSNEHYSSATSLGHTPV
jgi:hypothetical protein